LFSQSFVESAKMVLRVCCVRVDGSVYGAEIDDINEIKTKLLPSDAIKYPFGDCEYRVIGDCSDGIYLYFRDASEVDADLNIAGARMIIDRNLLEPPLYDFCSKDQPMKFFDLLPRGEFCLYRWRDFQGVDLTPAELKNCWHLIFRSKCPYELLASKRYVSLSQAIDEYGEISGKNVHAEFSAWFIKTYLNEYPSLTCGQIDRAHNAIIGSALFLLFEKEWRRVSQYVAR
jgi:hypothetical protein